MSFITKSKKPWHKPELRKLSLTQEQRDAIRNGCRLPIEERVGDW